MLMFELRQSRLGLYALRKDVTDGIWRVMCVYLACVGNGPRVEWGQRVEEDVLRVRLLREDVLDRL